MLIKAKYLTESDLRIRVNWINNPKINVSMFFEIPASLEKTIHWFSTNVGNNKRVDFSFFDENEELVAMGGFTGIDYINSHAEFYVMVNPELQGKGYGKKVSKWMYNYFFLKYDLNKIFLYTNDSNLRAFKIYEDCNFKLEGVLREHKFKNNQFQNRRLYGLLKEEWLKTDWKVNEINYSFE